MIQKITSSVLVLAALAFGVLMLAPTTHAATSTVDPGTALTNGVTAAGGGGSTKDDLPKLIQNIINTLLFIGGAVAVVMIVIGGIRYVTSNGAQDQIKAAKDTIMYSVIGLIVALLAYAIVTFVVQNIK